MSVIRIDSKAFKHNISVIKNLAPLEKISIVLKDNAYGHGLLQMAELAKKNDIKHAVVRYVNEAQKISTYFETVLVLAENSDKKIEPNIHLAINRLEDIKKIQKNTPVHLKVDTGMHRNGIHIDDLEIAISEIKSSGLILEGVFSHSRSSDELSSELFWQYKNFIDVKKRCESICQELQIKKPKFHFANSASLLRMKEDIVFDMVRVGIAAYGYSECDDVFDIPELKSVLSLWGEKIASRKVLKNQRVGYSGACEMDKECVISTYDIGYADGVFRHDGNEEFILDDGTKILGKISMDNISMMSDKDEVCIIDDAFLWAKKFNTISYEILVKLSQVIKREII